MITASGHQRYTAARCDGRSKMRINFIEINSLLQFIYTVLSCNNNKIITAGLDILKATKLNDLVQYKATLKYFT